MKCDEVRELMSERVDGCLDAAGGARLDEHLAGCPACRRDMADLKKTVAAVRGLPAVNAPDNLADRVRIRLPRRQWSFTEFVNLPQTRLAFAAGLIVIVTVYGLRTMTPAAKEASDAVQPAAAVRAPAAAAAPDFESGLRSSRAQPFPQPELAASKAGPDELRSRKRAAEVSAPVEEKEAAADGDVIREADRLTLGDNGEIRDLADAKTAPAPRVVAKPAAPAVAQTEQVLRQEPAATPAPAVAAPPALDVRREPVVSKDSPPAKGAGSREMAEQPVQEAGWGDDKAQQRVQVAGKGGAIWRGKAANAKAGLDYSPKANEAAPEPVQKLAFAEAGAQGQKAEAVAKESTPAEPGNRTDQQTLTLAGGTAAPAAPADALTAKDDTVARTTNSVTIRVRDFGVALAQIRRASVRVIDPAAGEYRRAYEYKAKAPAPTSDAAAISGTYTQVVLIADIDAAAYDELLARLTTEGEGPSGMSRNLNVSGRMAQVAVQNAALEKQAAPGERYLVRFTLLPFRAPVAEK